MSLSKEEYNAVPVRYCKHCLSLAIKGLSEDNDSFDYCDHCGSSDIGECSIEEWEALYRKAHKGISLLETKY